MYSSTQAFNQTYISFLRPLLKYASVIWYNCIQQEKSRSRLEKIQLEAAILVTGTTR